MKFFFRFVLMLHIKKNFEKFDIWPKAGSLGPKKYLFSSHLKKNELAQGKGGEGQNFE